MQAYIDFALTWVQQNEGLVALLTLSSILVFFGSLVFIPWLIIQLPSDYFTRHNSDHFNPLGDHPVAMLIVNVIRNLLGTVFILIGLLLLVLPGQGLLTIIIGFFITRFPGKRRFVYWLIKRDKIYRAMNWIRHKAHKADIDVEQTDD